MTKAVLVMDDMPEACFECGFCHFAFGEDRCQALESRKVELEGGKPDWCQLRQLPEKEETVHPQECYTNDYWSDEMKAGWNACLNEILK